MTNFISYKESFKFFIIALIILSSINGIGQNTIYSEDFESGSGSITTTSGGSYYMIDNDAEGDGCAISEGWEVSNSTSGLAGTPPSNGYFARVAGTFGCAQDVILVTGPFCPGKSSVILQFDYFFNHYASGDLFKVDIWNETSNNSVLTIFNETASDISGTYSSTITNLNPGTCYTLRIQYIGDYGWGAAIDNIVVEEPCSPIATAVADCNNNTSDLTITDLNGASGANITDNLGNVLETNVGIGTYTVAGVTSFTVDDANNASCAAIITPSGVCGDDCSSPIEISSLPFVTTTSVQDYKNQHDLGIGNTNYNDIFFSYTPSEDETVIISVYNPSSISIYVYSDCPNTALVGSNVPTWTESGYLELNLLAGATYYIVIDGDLDAIFPEWSDNDFKISIFKAESLPCNGVGAVDNFDDAIYICNQMGYCGTTDNSHDNVVPHDPDDIFTNDVDLVSIENNAWIKIKPIATEINFTLEVSSCSDGIQFFLVEYDGTKISFPCPDGNDCYERIDKTHGGMEFYNFTFDNMDLTKEYYIMIDGKRGDVCDYNFTVNQGIFTVDILEGDSLTFCGTTDFDLTTNEFAGINYTWSTDSGATWETPITTTEYNTGNISQTQDVILNATGLCDQKDTIHLINLATADASFTYPSNVVCKSESTNPIADNTIGTFSASSNDLVWINSGTGEINLNLTPAGDYTITHTIVSPDPLCADQTSDYNITISEGPTLSMDQDTVAICVGNSASFTVSGADTYEWTHNNDNNATLSESPLIDTSYYVHGTDADGCEAYDTVHVDVGEIPTLTITGADTINICPGSSAELYATSSEPINSWSWDNSGGNTANTDSIEAVTVNPVNETTYTLSVTTTYGCNASGDVTVAVGGYIPQIAQSNISLCSGDNTDLEVIGANNVRWSIYGDTIATTSIHNVTLDTAKNYTYTVTAEDNSGCSGANTLTVTVNELPVIDAGDYTSCNPGDVVNMQANQISGNTINSWNWDTGQTGSAININAPNTDTAEYTITVTDINNCSSEDTAIVAIGEFIPRIISIDGRQYCMGDTIKLTTLNNPSIDFWKDQDSTAYGNTDTVEIFTNSLSTGQSTITLKASQGSCSGKDTFLINLLDTPTINLSLNDAGTLQGINNYNICPGQEVILSVNSNNGIQYAFANNLGAILQNSTSDAFTTSNINDGDIIYVAVSNGVCASVINTPPFTISPPLSLNAGNDSSICSGENITLSGSMSFGDGQWYQSSIDPANALGSLNDSIYNVNSISVGQNIFLWQVNDPSCGVNYIDSLIITGLENQVNLFMDTEEENDTLIPVPSTLYTLSNNQTSLTWAVNDEIIGTGNDLDYTFNEPGTQVITLSAIDQNGCFVIDSMTVMIDAPFIIHFPNAFTPNGDNLNDVFGPVGYFDNLESYEISVYNRWGDMVFTSTDQKEAWNGKMLNTGDDLISGVYTYIMKYRTLGGFDNEQKMGSIILLR